MERKRVKRVIAVAALLMLLIIAYLAISVMSVTRAVQQFDADHFASAAPAEGDTIELCAIPGFMELLRQKALLGACLKMTETDSIGLLVNVRDSLIQLLIRGVPVRSVAIGRYELSPLFSRASPEAVYGMLSSPLLITGTRATFRKDPVSIRIAPRDTSEAVTDIRPDTATVEPVFFTITTNRNVRLCFAQQESSAGADRRAGFFFSLGERLRGIPPFAGAVARLRIPPYEPCIRIWIPRAEAKIIYRAIPREGMIALTL